MFLLSIISISKSQSIIVDHLCTENRKTSHTYIEKTKKSQNVFHSDENTIKILPNPAKDGNTIIYDDDFINNASIYNKLGSFVYSNNKTPQICKLISLSLKVAYISICEVKKAMNSKKTIVFKLSDYNHNTNRLSEQALKNNPRIIT